MRSKYSDPKELGTCTSLQLNNAEQPSSTHRGEDDMVAAERPEGLEHDTRVDAGILICVSVSISAACHSSDSVRVGSDAFRWRSTNISKRLVGSVAVL